MPEVGPAPILAALVGIGWTAVLVLVRGTAGARLPLVALLAVAGAWAGDAIGGRLDVDPLLVGDFHVLAASIGAWAGIAFAVVVSVLGPVRRS
ncbi:MAG: hypothetical protein MUC54_03280 [Chloroflexi bacterium]|nr:hypothetical protein [Chloroflexota bacterium]